MTERDTDIEFDFFDEPETEEATQRRRIPPRGPDGPRRPSRPPRGPTQLTPLLRLILLIVFGIFLLVLFGYFIQGCVGESKTRRYQSYMADMTQLSKSSDSVARELNDQLTTPGIKEQDLEAQLDGLAERQDQIVNEASDIDSPGPLREEHEHAIDAFQLRANGISGLARAFRETRASQNATNAGALLAAQAQRLIASDVIWDDFFVEPSKSFLRSEGVTGVAVPDSNSLVNGDLASTRSMEALWKRLHGAATGGTPTGLHGTGIVSLVALPANQQLSTDEETIVEATTDLAFAATIQNTGESQEVGIVVTLTIQKSPEPIVKTQRISLINPGETKRVVFEDLGQPPFGPRTIVKLDVKPVDGETNTSNNTAEYPVIFSLPR
jgi:hypothetical protein